MLYDRHAFLLSTSLLGLRSAQHHEGVSDRRRVSATVLISALHMPQLVGSQRALHMPEPVKSYSAGLIRMTWMWPQLDNSCGDWLCDRASPTQDRVTSASPRRQQSFSPSQARVRV
jgi:hypothetical protein